MLPTAAAVSRQLRVISVLPSATEMLCCIGGEALLVGRSHEDNFPKSISHVPVVTGQKTHFTNAADVDVQVSTALANGQSLYSLDTELIKQLRPDVILTQDICRVCAIDLATVERLAASMSPSPRVISLNPLGLDDVLRNVGQVGEAVGMEAAAASTRAGLEARLRAADHIVAASTSAQLSVAFVEWPDPLYVGGHWTPELIHRAGGTHPLNLPAATGGGAGKSFPVPPAQLVESDPDLLIFCPCGLGIKAARRELNRLQLTDWWPTLRAVRSGRVAVVDGDAMFNRPGPRLVEAFEWLVATIHQRPEVAPTGFPVNWIRPEDVPGPAATAGEEAARVLEIEQAHRNAVHAGKLQYTDPETGYTVFTQLQGIQRGYCCGSGCRHCPYGHQNVPADRKQHLRPPITVKVSSSPA